MTLATALLIIQIIGGIGGVAVDATKIEEAFKKLGLKPGDILKPEHVAAAIKASQSAPP